MVKKPSVVEILDHVVLVQVDVHIWSGRRKLRTKDLKGVDNDNLPPKDLASLGSKHIYNPKALTPFNTCKRQLERACEQVGTRFLKGYAVPIGRTRELFQRADEIRKEWDRARVTFMAEFDRERQAWRDQHPGWEHVFDSTVVSKDEVAAGMSFDYKVCSVRPAPGIDTDASLGRATMGLAGQLYKEIGQAARELWERSFEGKAKVSARVVPTLWALREKLEGLKFLDRNIGPIVTSLDATISAMPKEGAVAGNDLQLLTGAVLMLTDPRRMKTHGRGVLKGDEQPAKAPAPSAQPKEQLPLVDQAAAQGVPAQPDATQSVSTEREPAGFTFF